MRAVESTARREIILAAGAVGSPKLLQLSGIGDGATLRARWQSKCVHDLPAVGRGTCKTISAASFYLPLDRIPTLNGAFGSRFGQAAARSTLSC